MTRTNDVKHFFNSKLGKLIPILLIALLIGTASSTVYQFYTGAATATVQTPDLILRAGTDSSGSCTTYPCATVTVASPTSDFATIGLSFFASNTNTPQPASYYSNLTTIQNHRTGGASHTIKLITAKITAGAANLGGITIYYCATQTEFNPDGTPASACSGSISLTSGSAGWVSSSAFSSTLTNGVHSMGYIEVYAWAVGTASQGVTCTFQLGIQWL
jgi:hypothetical protein